MGVDSYQGELFDGCKKENCPCQETPTDQEKEVAPLFAFVQQSRLGSETSGPQIPQTRQFLP